MTDSHAQNIVPFSTTFVRQGDIGPAGQRGPWGDAKWPGNVSGYVVGAFLRTYHRPGGLFVDPMEGSGTSGDVARDLGIDYRGFDLHRGFDATTHDLKTALHGRLAASVFLHPAYMGMKQYVREDRDLSSVGLDIDRWTEMMTAVMRNAWSAMERDGHLGVLVGDVQKAGRFYDLAARVSGIAEPFLVKKIIREQANVSSANTAYSATFVATMHETLLVFKKRVLESKAVAA